MFSQILWVRGGGEGRGIKRAELMFCASSGGNLLRQVIFFLISCEKNLSSLIWGNVHNINSLTLAMSWLTIM